MILYLDTNSGSNSWDKMRQLCSQKFYGSPFADLVSLESTHSQDLVKAFLTENQKPDTGMIKNYFNLKMLIDKLINLKYGSI